MKTKTKNKTYQRQTIQKIKIAQYLKGVKTHPTAEMVYIEIKEELPTITLATVYRNLNQMAEGGHILRLELNGGYHYDAEILGHSHLFCQNCKKIEDFYQQETSEVLKKILNNPHSLEDKRFKASKATVIFEGQCSDCQ